MGEVKVVIFDPSLNIWMERIGVATFKGSLVLELNMYESKAGPRLENIAMATEEVGVARGSSKDADSSDNESVLEKVIPFLAGMDGCLVLIKRWSCGNNEFSHIMLRAVTESCSSVARKAPGPNPASSTTPTQPREGFGFNKLSDILMSFCICVCICM